MKRVGVILCVAIVSLAIAGPAQASYKAKVSGGTLTLTGNSKGDKLVLRLKKGARTTLLVDVGANGSVDFTFARKRFSKIIVNAGGGNDTVTISEKYGVFTTEEATQLNGGAGLDKLTGGSGPEILSGGPGSDTVAGIVGSDVFVWDSVDGSDKIDGGAGIDVLSVNGSAGDDTFAVNPNSARVLVTGPSSSVLNVGGVETIDLNALGGNDTITGGAVAGLTTLDLDGGDGNDTLNGSNGNDTLRGGLDADQVDGNAGNDTVFLGGGTDAFVWDPGDGSDAIDGQEDDDTLSFNGSAGAEIFTATASGGRFVLTRNVGTVTMDTDNVENLVLTPLGGSDSVIVNDLSTTDMTVVDILLDIAAAGDAAADSITVQGTGAADVIQAAAVGGSVQVTGLSTLVQLSGSEAANDRLTIGGLGGGDTVSGGALSGLIQLTLDGGDGNDDLFGGNGADTILGGEGADDVDGNGGNDVAFLGDANDTFIWDPGDGSDIVEGQDGTDTLRFNGSAGSEIFTASSNGARLLFTRNVGNIVMDTDDVELLDLNALGSTDTVTINDLAATDVGTVDLDLGVNGAGDAAVDAVTVNGSAGADVMSISGSAGSVSMATAAFTIAVSFAESANDVLTVNTSGGADVVGASGLAATSVHLTLNGGSGNDILVGSAGPDTFDCGTETDYADGGAGIDAASNCETVVNIP